MDRQVLSLLKPILDGQLHWSNEQFGEINGAFQAAYAAGLLGFGCLIDRIGTKKGYAISIAAWSLAAVGHCLVTSIQGFTLARVCLGLGEGGNFPSAIKTVADWFPSRERALATSIFNAGANVGAIAAPLTVPWIAYTWGWQSAFVIIGLAGFFWLFFWLPLYDRPERHPKVNAAERAFIQGNSDKHPAEKIPWLHLLGYRQTWSFIVAKFLTDPVWWFLLIWLPDYFSKTRGLELKTSWAHLASIYAIVTVLSIIGGWFTGHLIQLGWSTTRARKTGLFVFALCVMPVVFATHASDWGAVLLIGLAGAAHQAWSANLYTTVSDMFPKADIASVTGIGGMAGSVGSILCPIYTGKLLDRFEAAGHATTGYAILFGISGCTYLLAFGFQHLLAPRFSPIRA